MARDHETHHPPERGAVRRGSGWTSNGLAIALPDVNVLLKE